MPCRVAEGRPRHWAGEVRRQVRGRLEARELWDRPQTRPAMRGWLLWVEGRWGLGGTRRGSATTGPGVPPGRRSMTTPSGRGAGRGTTVAQTPVQLADAAAQRDAREAGQTREAAGGDRHRLRGGSSLRCIIPGCHFTSGGAHWRHAVCVHLPQLFGEIFGLTNLSNRKIAQLPLAARLRRSQWATPLMRRLEAFAGWESPVDYSASPPNSIALLLQWNVVLSLMGTMGRRQRERCRMWQPSSPAPVQATDSGHGCGAVSGFGFGGDSCFCRG